MHITNSHKILLSLMLLVSIAHAHEYNIWIRPVYYSDQQYANDSLYGYITNAGGILGGVDTRINSNTTIGAGLGYFNAKQKDINSTSSQISINNYQATLYGSYSVYEATNLDWSCNIGVNDYKNSRYVVNSMFATGTNEGQQYSARAVLQKTYYKNLIEFTPQLNINVMYAHQNCFTEQGAGSANQYVSAKNNGIFTLGAGFKMLSTYTRSRWLIRPEMRCVLFYDVFSSNINALSAFLIGGPVINTSAMPGRGSGQFGVSLKGYASRKMQIALNYDLLLKASYFNNVVSMGINYNL